jgi:uncharacterized protein with PIN domain
MTSHEQFACDAMLGGLARWLRGAGYDASWRADIADWDLVRQALAERRMLLTCDTGIFRIGIVRDGEVPALLVPHDGNTEDQLAWVLRQRNLTVREPRCMACGGELTGVAKEIVRGRVPARTFAWLDRFYECRRCGKLFWEGTHWQRIAARLARIAAT